MKRTTLVIAMLLLLGTQLVWSQDPNNSQDELIFETLHDRPLDVKVPDEVNYILEFEIPGLRILLNTPTNLEQWVGYQHFSQGQQKIIKEYSDEIISKGAVSGRYPKPDSMRYRVWAVSETDARLLVSSLLENDVQLANEELEFLMAEKVSWGGRLKEQEIRLPQLKQDLDKWQKAIPEAIAAYKANISCVFEDNDESSAFSHALKNADDVSIHIREVKFELIGLDAKLDTIDAFQTPHQEGRVNLSRNIQESRFEWNRMLTTLEIERAGALARKAAYEKTFEQAKAVIEAIHTRDQFEEKVSLCQASIGNARDHVDRFSSRIEGLSRVIQNTRPLKILDNKVFIYPVVH